MNPDRDSTITDALDRLAPDDAEPRDWDAVLQRAARGRGLRWAVRRFLSAVGVAGLAVVLAVLFVRLSGPDQDLVPATEPPAGVPLRFSVFNLPPNAVAGPFSDVPPLPGQTIDESSVRLASVVGTTRIFVARTKGGDYCIGHGSTSGRGPTSMSCGDEVNIRDVGALTLGSDTMESGLVPDGVTRARVGDRAVEVENNVFLLTTRDAQKGPVALLTATGWQTVGDPAVTTEAQLAVLRRPQIASDRGSGFDGTWPLGFAIDPDSIRLVRDAAPTATSAGGRYYVGVRNDGAVCVLVSPERLVACGEFDDAEIPGWRLSYPIDTGHVVVGLVPDGYNEARIVQAPETRVAIVDNLYVLQHVHLTNVEVFDGDAWNHLRPSNVGVLQRPQNSRDVLPGALLRLPIEYGSPAGLNPGTVHFAGDFGGERYWVSGGAVALCLHGTPDQARCVSSEDSFNRGAVIVDPSASGGTWTRHLAGIIDDGFATATVGSRQVPVVNNVFVFDGRPLGDRLILSGAAGTRVVDISRRGR